MANCTSSISIGLFSVSSSVGGYSQWVECLYNKVQSQQIQQFRGFSTVLNALSRFSMFLQYWW